MRRPLGIRRSTLWLAGLSAVILLLLFPTGAKNGRRVAKPHRDPVVMQRPPHFSPIIWRTDVPSLLSTQESGAPGFVEVGAEDHNDGRRDDPENALVWHRQQRSIIERQYGHAIASLNLPADEAEKLAELLTARREAIVDGRDAAQQLGIVGPEANAAVRQSVEADTDEIKQLVGSDAYFGTLELAPTVSSCKELLEGSVGNELAAEGIPLSTDQLYSLAEDYVGAVYSPAASEGPQDPDSVTGLTPQYRAFLDKVSASLTPEQASAFRGFLVKQSMAMQPSGETSG
jgi:hypothetical protein